MHGCVTPWCILRACSVAATGRLRSSSLGALLSLAGLPVAAAAPTTGPSLRVDVRHGRHTISADIYGVNFASDIGSASAVAKLGITVDRWGGNSTTRYDWTTGVHNTGADWYFENIPPDGTHPAAPGG